MTQTAKAQEPSMEEILASIRRIIADDDAGKTAKPSESVGAAAASDPPADAPEPPPAASSPSSVNQPSEIDTMLAKLDLEPQPAASKASSPEPAKAAPIAQPDVLDLTEAMAAPAPGPRVMDTASEPLPQPSRLERGLMSPSTLAAVDNAFNSLAHTVLGQNARTLEDLVKEMLRPMLKSWLDDNLPGTVDRIVRAEIERVSRGR